jgi:hypothetical protein
LNVKNQIKCAALFAEAHALLADLTKSSPTKKGMKIVEIKVAEAGGAEIRLTATPFAPVPASQTRLKLNSTEKSRCMTSSILPSR